MKSGIEVVAREPYICRQMNRESDNMRLDLTAVLGNIGGWLALLAILFFMALTIAFIIRMEGYA